MNQSPLTLLLFLNSLFCIGLVLNQNESKKDSSTNQSERSTSNPLERITSICLIFQLILLIIKLKITDS